MSRLAGLDRRQFLAVLVTGAAGAAVVAACGDDGEGGPTTTTAPVPATLTEALAVLAAAVREAEPDLEPLDVTVDPADPQAVARAVADLEAAAQDDLAQGAVVLAAGWILSVTEARLCLAAAP